MSENGDEVYEGELDPRVQEELERLNKSSQQINSLETSLTKARNDYRNLLQVTKMRIYSDKTILKFRVYQSSWKV